MDDDFLLGCSNWNPMLGIIRGPVAITPWETFIGSQPSLSVSMTGRHFLTSGCPVVLSLGDLQVSAVDDCIWVWGWEATHSVESRRGKRTGVLVRVCRFPGEGGG